MAATYTMRQARMDLGERIVTNLEDEDIDVLFEDVPDEPPKYHIGEGGPGPGGERIKFLVHDDEPFFKNKDNRKRMEAAKRELLSVIRKWMHEAKESPV